VQERDFKLRQTFQDGYDIHLFSMCNIYIEEEDGVVLDKVVFMSRLFEKKI
jgi:hypothetical protein